MFRAAFKGFSVGPSDPDPWPMQLDPDPWPLELDEVEGPRVKPRNLISDDSSKTPERRGRNSRNSTITPGVSIDRIEDTETLGVFFEFQFSGKALSISFFHFGAFQRCRDSPATDTPLAPSATGGAEVRPKRRPS